MPQLLCLSKFESQTTILKENAWLSSEKICKTSSFSNWRLKRSSSAIFRHFGKDPQGNGCGHPAGALPGFFTLTGRWEEPVIPLHSLHMAMYAIRAYLLPCNHHKACRETKRTIRDRAALASSKQISISVEAPLNGTG